jgi:lipopolysaccharide biosynthesis glycosyltransferase
MTNYRAPFGQTELRDSRLGPSHNTRSGGMEILCACDDRFLPHLATMLCSLLEHNTVFRIHLFYSLIDDKQLVKLESFVEGYGSTLARYKIDPASLQDLRVDEHVSIVTYYRVLAPRILPTDIDKVLYLDSDVIVRRSLIELWKTDLRDYALAAVTDQYIPDCDPERLGALGLPAEVSYFNGGVLLINLKLWRECDIPGRALAFARNNREKVRWWDQDALNAVLVHRWKELPQVWNSQSWSFDKLMPGREDAAIVHFSGDTKPWHWSLKHVFKSEYGRYRLKTPWPRYRLEGKRPWYHRLRTPLRNLIRRLLPVRTRRWWRSRITIL